MVRLLLLMYKLALSHQSSLAMKNTEDDLLKNPRVKAVHDRHGKIKNNYCTGYGRRGTDILQSMNLDK